MSSSSSSLQPPLLQVLASSVAIADRAGQIVRDVMAGGKLGIVEKTGKNDLQTEADRSAQNCILASLAKQFPSLKVVGEEGELDCSQIPADWVVEARSEAVFDLECPAAYVDIPLEEMTVWVDPLDGTAEYTQGLLDHVTVLIGIAVGQTAVAGVIHQPYWNYKNKGSTLGRTFYGLVGAGVAGITAHPLPSGQRIITTTRSHGTGLIQDTLDLLEPTEVLRVGGAGHKVLLLLEGVAHAYVFPSPGCKKWDTCAPEAILHAMGGRLTDMWGNTYQYHATVEHRNGEGVLATAAGEDHQWYIQRIPQELKEQIKNSLRKK